MYDLMIVGAGPAGVAAAIYAQRAKLNTIVLERQPISGGQVINTYEVDNYPGLPGVSGIELSEKLRNHAEGLGVTFVTEELQRVEDHGTEKHIYTDKGSYHTKTVLIATGANHRKLHVPGEDELLGMGVSYCATCDGAFFKNLIVCVVGGGDVALEDAIFLARICKKVYLIHRREELRGAKILQERLFALQNVEVIWDTTVEAIQGTDMVQSVTLYNKKKQEESILAVDGVFVAVGIVPNSQIFQELVQLDEGGYIVAKEDCATSVPGIYAAGDVRTKQLRQIITAAADGANAVTSVQEYLLTI